jgi:hypothetical protein
MEQIAMVISGAMILMGRLGKNHNEWEMDDPRIVTIVQMPNGQTGINIAPFPGDPKRINFGAAVKYCIPRDQNVLNAYIEQTSGIRLASSLPGKN